MTSEQFLTTMTRRPFLPFVIRMADGGSLAVRHPEHVAISPTGRTVVVSLDDGSFDIVDLLLVTRLEVEAPPNRPAP